MSRSPSKEREQCADQAILESKSLIASQHNMLCAAILKLPNELLEKIFSNLTTTERLPLGLTCKRFREADCELAGKEFKYVKVEWDDEGYDITRHVSDGNTVHFLHIYESVYYDDEWKPLDSSPHNLILLKNARTKNLTVMQRSDQRDNEKTNNDIGLLHQLLKTVNYDCLKVYFEDFSHCSEDLISTLIANRNLEKSKIFIHFETAVEGTSGCLPLRNELMRIPKVDKFRLDCTDYANEDERHPVDDDLLLHITACTNYAELNTTVDCTARGILAAFEMVCLSPLISKHKHMSPNIATNL